MQNEMTIKGRQYIVTSSTSYDDTQLVKAEMNSKNIGGMAMVRLTTGRVEKPAYFSLTGQFAGWVQI